MASPRNTHTKTVTVGLLGLSLLLAIDRLGKVSTGNEIWDALEEQNGKRIHSGTIYTTLKRLREKGLVTESVTKHGRPIRAYKLTELGAVVLDDYQRIFSNDNKLGGEAT